MTPERIKELRETEEYRFGVRKCHDPIVKECLDEIERMRKTLLHIIEMERVIRTTSHMRELRMEVPLQGDSMLVSNCLWGLTGEGQGF